MYVIIIIKFIQILYIICYYIIMPLIYKFEYLRSLHISCIDDKLNDIFLYI